MLFAFGGQRESVGQLMTGSLAVLPASIREFWLATADLAAGDSETARRRLEQLLPAADSPMRLALERRLARSSAPLERLDALAEGVIAAAAHEHGHDELVGAKRSLFSKQARATQIVIGLNVLMFVAEMGSGGATDPDALYRLGALYAPAVRAGEWWRLPASLFLHLGWLHLAMNLFALWILGPFVEFALGFRRYLMLYLLAGIGSMGAVLMLASGSGGDQVTVGASGCVMGLVGATGALMARAWMTDKSLSARRRLVAVLMILVMQTLFDLVVPQVSMTAHLSGALIGFAVAGMLPNRLKKVSR
jgi:rhomboid protease GluP